ncbi:calcium/sodium antiporter [Salinigranum sp. GCM10025319]|uniref:calcium/sodium antiporter n=1 Tax=Salinigranum sp. GCM10025319 TaxID=3252687 RepID=UPI00361F5F24
MVGFVVQVGILVVSVAGLWLGARSLVDAVVRLARQLDLSERTIGLTVVAAGTSMPELVVTADAALAGLGNVAVGNVVGSNVYNLAFILGVVSLLRVIPIDRSLVHRDGVVLVASTLLGVVVLFDLTITRVEGVVLLASFVAYTAYLLRSGGDDAGDTDLVGDDDDGTDTAGEFDDAAGDATHGAPDDDGSDPAGVTTGIADRVAFRGRDGLLLVGGLAVILASGHAMVEASTTLARGAGVSEWVIGGTVVAAGTSTPEFAVSLVAMRRGSVGVSVGNVAGSNVFNLLAILGIGAILRPLVVAPAALETLAWLVVIVVAAVGAMWSGRRLSRAEGGLFALSEVGRWVLGLLGILG